jgi:hypothetical protein
VEEEAPVVPAARAAVEVASGLVADGPMKEAAERGRGAAVGAAAV